MIDLALRQERGPVTLAAIAERQGISLSYLEQLFGKLRRSHLVDSIRGPGGGYVLANAPHAISVADVIAAVDEDVDATMCGGKEDCHGGHGSHGSGVPAAANAIRLGGGTFPGAVGKCMTHDLWATLNQRVHDYLDSVTLADLVRQAREREAGITTISATLLHGSNHASSTHASHHLNTSKPAPSLALGAN
jgi:Rrf2 family iron-sulfur cluster assembly transcriptional regulator